MAAYPVPAGRSIWFPSRLRLPGWMAAGITLLSAVTGSRMGRDDKPSESVFGGWPHGDSPDVDDATLEEKVLGSRSGVWKGGCSSYDG